MKLAKKLDKAFKKFIPADCRNDKDAYQALFARVSQIAFDEYDQMPWVPADKELPDHRLGVMVWIEKTTEDPEVESTWHYGWYDWQHEDWIAGGIPVSETKGRWKITHWVEIKAPV